MQFVVPSLFSAMKVRTTVATRGSYGCVGLTNRGMKVMKNVTSPGPAVAIVNDLEKICSGDLVAGSLSIYRSFVDC